MAACFENFNGRFDWDSKRNTYSAIISGLLFFIGCWMMIDTSVNYTSEKENPWTNLYFLLTVGSALSMFMVNSVSNSAVQGTSMDEGVFGLRGARLWLMIGFIASFACLVAGIWIMFGDYVFNKNSKDSWPGVALFLHTFLIFISSMVYKFGRTEELWD